MSLILGLGQPGRRTGLTRGYTGASLLQTINAPANQNRNTMPPRAVIKPGATRDKQEPEPRQEVEGDIFRPPDSSDEEYDAGDMIKTTFGSKSEKVEEERENDVATTYDKEKCKAIVHRNAAASTRSRRANISPASSQLRSSPKRKSPEGVMPLGKGMLDEFGRVKVKVNKRQKTFQASGYGKAAFKAAPSVSPDVEEDSPKKTFKGTPTFDSPQKSDSENGPGFKAPKLLFDESPVITPNSAKKFYDPRLSQTPDKEEEIRQPEFKMVGFGLDDFFESTGADLDDSSLSLPEELQKSTVEVENPATQRPAFKLYDTEDDLLGKAHEVLLSTQQSKLPSMSPNLLDHDDEFATLTQRAKCPMCGKPIDPADLKECGDMNTRQQERFCRSHQKKTAREDWTLNGYPEIDWNKLDSRISRHHSFIKKLINGADSHYRGLLADTVNAGKNRTLMKSDFNPTPGYYGTRGLRAISENTMRKFTPLLKKRMVVDRLMAARGFTPYVEYVVVPEVAVRLIMEDMGVEVARAREIMAESLAVGQLLSEEVMEVVIRRGSEEVEDSDE